MHASLLLNLTIVPAVRLPTIGRRAFLVADARTWNDLRVDVTSAVSTISAHLQKTTKTPSVSTLICWPSFITARCTLVQSAVLRSHVVCLSVCLSVCDVGEL